MSIDDAVQKMYGKFGRCLTLRHTWLHEIASSEKKGDNVQSDDAFKLHYRIA